MAHNTLFQDTFRDISNRRMWSTWSQDRCFCPLNTPRYFFLFAWDKCLLPLNTLRYTDTSSSVSEQQYVASPSSSGCTLHSRRRLNSSTTEYLTSLLFALCFFKTIFYQTVWRISFICFLFAFSTHLFCQTVWSRATLVSRTPAAWAPPRADVPARFVFVCVFEACICICLWVCICIQFVFVSIGSMHPTDLPVFCADQQWLTSAFVLASQLQTILLFSTHWTRFWPNSIRCRQQKYLLESP